ncbi:MAG: cytochrome-c peroxidase [Bacteroidia bacterium]|nr:cytochrome-c peroxidase [Bacteroidia bacterium]
MKALKILLPAAAFVVACGTGSEQKAPEATPVTTETSISKEEQDLLTQAQAMFKALPATAENAANPLTPEKIELGKLLFFDTRLSKTGHNSCNSCHNLATFGVDNEVTSEGDAGKRGGRNSPTVLNAALHAFQFWDGRAKDVEEQAGGPILNPVEMAIPSKEFMVKKLKGIELYQKQFAAAFPGDKDPITYDNLTKAIAAFERTLITPSRFDKYLGGDHNALTADEKKGMQTFIRSGCTACHMGATLGGTMFQKFGLVNDYRPLTGSKGNDQGRKDLTKQEADKDMFKVPSLRNITKTHPYFHDGSVADLATAIKVMGKAQLNKDLTDTEVKELITFLQTVEADVPETAKAAPAQLTAAR